MRPDVVLSARSYVRIFARGLLRVRVRVRVWARVSVKALATVLVGLLGAASVSADVAAGEAAYGVCAACHGSSGEGNIALNAPRLAGQEPWYMRRQLAAYRAGHRGSASGDMPGMQMRPMAMATADPTKEANIIEYIQTLTAAPSAITVAGDPAAGKAGYAVCVACHGGNGEGLEALGGPQLAGQNDWYLVRQIKNYQNDMRAYDAADTYGQQMKPMAGLLATDKAINDVVAYINTLR
ncbi:MAG: c-type cytochrome [Gammaproteobacteria bacterium]|nr:c-type cytochrome [Gammaproteobacteria bacterium]